MPTPNCAVIVAHGSPSDPAPQEAALQALAAQVGARLPGWTVRGATLAAEGRFDAALEGLEAPLLYPFFMARGYFTGKVLKDRLNGRDATQLPPFGTEAGLISAIGQRLEAELAKQGWHARDTALLVAAHGSAISRTSAESTLALAESLSHRLPFRLVRAGFVEQAPFLQPAAEGMGQAICLQYFALNAGHVLDDVPAALTAAGFEGPVLPPFIDWPETAALIAASLAAQQV